MVVSLIELSLVTERLAEIQLGVAFGGGITARTPDRETIFLLDAALASAFPANLEDYRERFVAEPEPASDEQEALVDVGDDES